MTRTKCAFALIELIGGVVLMPELRKTRKAVGRVRDSNRTTGFGAKHPTGVFCVILVLSSLLWANDWPQWKGPNRDSICTETDLLQEWPEEGPELLWKCTGLGVGYATPAIAKGMVFATGDFKLTEEGKRLQYATAFDLHTQERLWISPIGRPGQNGACATPTVDGPLLYVISGDGNLVCLETDSGQEVWRKSMTRQFDGKPMEQWKYSESPLVNGEKYPELKQLGALDMFRPPWDDRINTRCWPNVIPLPDGHPAPYISLTMDRVQYPGIGGWTYGAPYLYHGFPKPGEREDYEYSIGNEHEYTTLVIDRILMHGHIMER